MIMRLRAHQLPALVAAPVLAFACAACSSSPAGSGAAAPAGHDAGSFPTTISSFVGDVRIPARPDRIVSLSPTATEMLYAIGAGHQVKAVDANSNYPKRVPVTSLSAYTPNAHSIASYRPDLVVISDNVAGIGAKLNALSIPVLDLPPADDLSQEYTEIDQLGQATGNVAQAQQEVASLKSEISSIVASAPSHAKPLTYYYEISHNPDYSVTSSTFVGNLLSMLGMRSIADRDKGAAAAGGYPSLSPAFIRKANPDYIILADTGKTGGGQDAATVGSRPGWSSLRAVKDKHIILLNPDVASRWGPRVTTLLQDVANGIKSS
jgi:iron complex transport system substrate-binding protein